MEEEIVLKAKENYLKEGFSCGEAIVKAIKEAKIIEVPEEIIKVASPFKTGIGKKRNMGWGDLKSFYIYEVRNNNDININERMITYRDKRHEYCELLRPHTTSDIIAVLRNNYTLLECDLTHGTVNPPYWRKNLVVSRAKFVKVL